MSQLDLSDPRIKECYQQARSGAIDWFVLGYGGTRNVLSVESSGSGISDLQTALTGPIQYAYVKSNDKFFIVLYTAADASSLLKAKSAVHKRNLADILVFHHLVFSISSPSELDEAKLAEKASSPDLLTPSDDASSLSSSSSSPAPERKIAAASISVSAPSSSSSPAPTPSPAVPLPQSDPAEKQQEEEEKKEEEREIPKPEPVKTFSPLPASAAFPAPSPVAASPARPTPSSSSSAPKKSFASEEDALLAEMNEEELAKLLEETGAGAVSKEARAEPLKGLDKAIVFVYEDPAVKLEKMSKELEDLKNTITKIEENAYDVPVVLNFNSIELFNDELLARLGKALSTNTVAQELLMANCAIGATGAVAIIEGLMANKSITHLNLESNSIGGPGLEALAKLVSETTTLKELRITNQRATISGKPESNFLKALEKNTSIQKLGFSPKDQTTRNLVDKFIFRNRDLARQARVAESKKK